MIDYKIRFRNDNFFKCLGNIFPFDYKENYNRFVIGYSEKMKNLLNQITDNNNEDLFLQYLSKSINKCLSSLCNLSTLNFGLTKYDKEYIKSNNDFIVSNNVRVYVINKKYDFYFPEKDFYITLSKLTENRFYNKWKKLFETYAFEYNPIKPYDMTIHDHNFDEHGGETIIDRTHSDESETTNEIVYDDSENGYQGFNSSQFNPVNKTSNTSKDTSNSKVDVEGQVKTTHGRTVDSDRDITRSGNIGNITQQELIERERNLWEYQIYNIIFRDLDSIYTRPKYYERGY